MTMQPNLNDQEKAQYIKDLPEYVELPGVEKRLVDAVAKGHNSPVLLQQFMELADRVEGSGK